MRIDSLEAFETNPGVLTCIGVISGEKRSRGKGKEGAIRNPGEGKERGGKFGRARKKKEEEER